MGRRKKPRRNALRERFADLKPFLKIKGRMIVQLSGIKRKFWLLVLVALVSGVFRYRHLMLNLADFLPHCKKDNKVESKDSKGTALNELVKLSSCSSCLFFLDRNVNRNIASMHALFSVGKGKTFTYGWPSAPVVRLSSFWLMQGSRPIPTFSSNFDKSPHWKLLKELISQIFGTSKDHRKSKPYHDHVFVFSIADGHIWFRNYQISSGHTGTAQKLDRGDSEKMTLVEVGPRFCLNPIKIFAGSFGSPTLSKNPFYVSPNMIRSMEKRQKAGKYPNKVKAKTRRKMHELENPLKVDENYGKISFNALAVVQI